jgi:hypothetical protein
MLSLSGVVAIMEERQHDLLAAQLRHDVRGVGVGRQQHPFRPHAAARRGEAPGAALARDALDRAPGEDAGAGGDRRATEAPHIGERLDRPGTKVEKTCRIGRGACLGARLLGIEDAHRRAERLPLPRPLPDLRSALLARAAVDRADALQLAGYVVLVDDVEHRARRIAQQVEEAAAIDRPQLLLQGGRHHPEPGIDEPGAASRRAVADLDRLEHDDAAVALGQVQRRRQAGVACTDDGDVGDGVAGEFLSCGWRRRRLLPEPVRASIVQHLFPSAIMCPSPARGPASPRSL